MFALHERTRRRWGRAALLLFALIPATGVGGWVAWLRRPGADVALVSHLELMTGLALRLQDARTTRPGGWTIAAVAIACPETGQPLLTAAQVTVSESGQGVSIVCRRSGGTEIGLKIACERLAASLLTRPAEGAKPLRIMAENAKFAASEAPQALSLLYAPHPTAPRLQLARGGASSRGESEPPEQVTTWTRNRALPTPRTEVVVASRH